MKTKNQLRPLALVCIVLIALSGGCASTKSEVAAYRGDGSIRYMEYTAFAFLTNRGFMLDLPAFDLSEPQNITYSLEGIPISRPVGVWLALPPSGSERSPLFQGSISVQIVSSDGLVVLDREAQLGDMRFTDHGIKGARGEASFPDDRDISFKAGSLYRLRLKFVPDGKVPPNRFGNLVLEASITP